MLTDCFAGMNTLLSSMLGVYNCSGCRGKIMKELFLRIPLPIVILYFVLSTAPAVDTRWVDWFDTIGSTEMNFWDRYSLAVIFAGMVLVSTFAFHILFWNSVKFGPKGRFHPVKLIDYVWYLGGGFLVAVALHEIQVSQMNAQHAQEIEKSDEINQFLNSEDTVLKVANSCEILGGPDVAEEDYLEFLGLCVEALKGTPPIRLGEFCNGNEMYYSSNDNHSSYPTSDSRERNVSQSLDFLLTVCGNNMLLRRSDDEISSQRNVLRVSSSEFSLDRLLSIHYLFSLLVALKLLKTSCSIFPKSRPKDEAKLGTMERYF